MDILRTALLALIVYVTKVFKWRHLLAYFSLSTALILLTHKKNMPELLLLYLFMAFATYVFYGILAHRIKSTINKKSISAVPRNAVKLRVSSLLSIFTIGYFFKLLGTNEYLSFFATIILFFIFSMHHSENKKASLYWNAGFVFSLLHSAIFFGGKNLLQPAYYTFLYTLAVYVFFAAKDAFSFACIPEELKEGMIPAESIFHDGKKYVFGSMPFPTTFGLVRYVAGDILLKRRVIASFFAPLTKKNILEIRKIAKEHKRQVFLVQKEIDFLPFVVLGAIAAFLTA